MAQRYHGEIHRQVERIAGNARILLKRDLRIADGNKVFERELAFGRVQKIEVRHVLVFRKSARIAECRKALLRER